MKNSFKFILIFSFLVLFPLVSFAAGTCDSVIGLGGIICKMGQILQSIVPVLVSLGLIYFVWGVISYMIADGEEAKKKGRDRMIYGIIGLAVIVGLWGFVNLINSTFFGSTIPSAPKLNTGTTGSCSTPTSSSPLGDYLNYITCLINASIIPLIFALAAVMFIWGVLKFFIINADEEAQRAQGKQFMIWGIIALATMVSMWGLVNILGITFGLHTSILPEVHPPGQGSSSSSNTNTNTNTNTNSTNDFPNGPNELGPSY